MSQLSESPVSSRTATSTPEVAATMRIRASLFMRTSAPTATIPKHAAGCYNTIPQANVRERRLNPPAPGHQHEPASRRIP